MRIDTGVREAACHVNEPLSPGAVEVRTAQVSDIGACKAIADQQRDAIGFLPRPVFTEAIQRGQLLVAVSSQEIVGFVRFNHRRRGVETALYDICVDTRTQRQGVGRSLMQALAEACRRSERIAIVLRCPENLPANNFYSRLGFQRIAIEPGRRRPLVVWHLDLMVS